LRIVDYVLPLILCTTVAQATVAQAGEDCRLKAVASLPASFDDSGGMVVPMKIGTREVSLLVDTGGIGSMLTAATAAQLGLETHHISSVEFRGFGGVLIDRYVTAHDIVIGNLKTANYEFPILPDGTLHGADGILAPDILLAFDNDFDFAHARLNLMSADHCPGEVVYWTKEPYAELHLRLDEQRHIEFHVELDGKSVLAFLDTGASQSIMSLDSAESLFGFAEDNPDLKLVEGVAPNGLTNIHTYVYPFRTLTFGGVTVNHPRIFLHHLAESQLSAVPRLTVGMNVLRQLHLYISYRDKTLYITPASAQ
jgi:predicted aspartyl protease